MSKIEKIQCGHDLGDGRKCPEMILNRKGDIRAHMVKVHGLDPYADSQTPVAETQPSEVAQASDPRWAKMAANAVEVQKQQLARLRKSAPDIKFGVSQEKSELEQKTEWLKKHSGLVTEDEEVLWPLTEKADMSAAAGNIPIFVGGEPFRHMEHTAFKQKKAILCRLEAEQQANAKERYNKYIADGKTAADKAAAGMKQPPA
jgi:hypothetical protein